MSHCDNIAIGLDIGGTNIKAGLLNESGDVLFFESSAIERDGHGVLSSDFILQFVFKILYQVKEHQRVVGIGVCTPGILNIHKDTVRYAVNLGWKDIPLVSIIRDRFNLPVFMESDIIAAAIGEHQFGNARNKSEFLFMSIGTGIGAVYYREGRFFNNSMGSIIDIGHISIDHKGSKCSCGNVGCLEQFVSGSALISRVAKERMYATTILNSADFINQKLDVSLIYDAALAGDEYSCRVLEEAGSYLGGSIVDMVHIFGPCPIIIGGGVSNCSSYYIESASRIVTERLVPFYAGDIEIIPAAKSESAAVMGAASEVFKRICPQSYEERIG